MKSDTVGTSNFLGNTNKKCRGGPRIRARSWCFTWNNYTMEDVTHLTKVFNYLEIKKYIFQEELSESGTEHLQGCVNFNNAVSFNTVVGINDKIHWEKCKNIKASIKYCSKEDTRNGKMWMHGIESHELWKKKVPLMTTKELYADMKRQMIADVPGIGALCRELEG